MMRSPASLAVNAFTPKDVMPRWWRTGRHGQRPSSISSISPRRATVYSLTSIPQGAGLGTRSEASAQNSTAPTAASCRCRVDGELAPDRASGLVRHSPPRCDTVDDLEAPSAHAVRCPRLNRRDAVDLAAVGHLDSQHAVELTHD